MTIQNQSGETIIRYENRHNESGAESNLPSELGEIQPRRARREVALSVRPDRPGGAGAH